MFDAAQLPKQDCPISIFPFFKKRYTKHKQFYKSCAGFIARRDNNYYLQFEDKVRLHMFAAIAQQIYNSRHYMLANTSVFIYVPEAYMNHIVKHIPLWYHKDMNGEDDIPEVYQRYIKPLNEIGREHPIKYFLPYRKEHFDCVKIIEYVTQQYMTDKYYGLQKC